MMIVAGTYINLYDDDGNELIDEDFNGLNLLYNHELMKVLNSNQKIDIINQFLIRVF